MTFDEFLNEQLKDPEFKREYDALEGWYQEELRKQEAMKKPRRRVIRALKDKAYRRREVDA